MSEYILQETELLIEEPQETETEVVITTFQMEDGMGVYKNGFFSGLTVAGIMMITALMISVFVSIIKKS